MPKKFLWDGLNLKRFAVVAIWPQNKSEAVILMRSRWPADDPTPWCVEYHAGGHYFATVAEAFAYCGDRKFKMEMRV